jgi:CDP-paratose synthetase
MAILLTGAGGFLGRNLINALLLAGHDVVGISRKSVNEINEKINQNVGILKLYSTDLIEMERIFIENKIDVIIHTATAYGLGVHGMSDAISSNMTFPLKLIETALQFGKPALINTDTFLNKNNKICEYLYPYCLSKFYFDKLVRRSSESIGFKYVNLRLEHMYGNGENPNKFFTYVISSCINNSLILKLTKGEQIRDFIHVSDVVSAFLIILQRILLNDHIDSEYSVGSGTSISLKDFVEKVQEITKTKTYFDFGSVPYFDGEPMYSFSNNERLRILGWEPRVNLEEGICTYIYNAEMG